MIKLPGFNEEVINWRGRWSKAISAVMTVCYLANLWNYAIVDNISYLASSVAYEKSFALTERIVDRMEQTKGYEDFPFVI